MGSFGWPCLLVDSFEMYFCQCTSYGLLAKWLAGHGFGYVCRYRAAMEVMPPVVTMGHLKEGQGRQFSFEALFSGGGAPDSTVGSTMPGLLCKSSRQAISENKNTGVWETWAGKPMCMKHSGRLCWRTF